MKRTLIVNGEKYDLESSVVTIMAMQDSLFIKIADNVAAGKPEQDDAAILAELLQFDETAPVTKEKAFEPVGPAAIPEPEQVPLNLAKNGDQSTPVPGQEPDIEAMKDQPTKLGILPRGKQPLKGTKRVLTEDEEKQLRTYRRDLGVVIKTPEELERYKYPIVRNKKNEPAIGIEIVSPEFKELTEEAINKALLALAFKEQQVTSDGFDRDNFLAIDIVTRFLVNDITDETAGKGLFQFLERVSVYENPVDTKRSHPPDGKTKT